MYSRVHPEPIKTSRIETVKMRLNDPKNVLIMFLFPLKHSYVLMVKITPGVNNLISFLHGMKELR